MSTPIETLARYLYATRVSGFNRTEFRHEAPHSIDEVDCYADPISADWLDLDEGDRLCWLHYATHVWGRVIGAVVIAPDVPSTASDDPWASYSIGSGGGSHSLGSPGSEGRR